MQRRATHGEQMTMLSVMFMGVWAAFLSTACQSGVGWGMGAAAAVLALLGTALLVHNAAWAIGYKTPGAVGFHCLLNGALLAGTALLASRGHGAVRWTLMLAALAPASGFYFIARFARRNGG